MSRPARSKIKIILAVVTIAVVAAAGVTWAYVSNSPSHKVEVTANAQKQITEITYRGEQGVDALSLLKRHATVQTKHYSFGDQVVSINGMTGNGPKYWTFYVNGKMSDTGAGAYKTKDGDKLTWRLQ